MRLFVSFLLVAAATAAFGQGQAVPQTEQRSQLRILPIPGTMRVGPFFDPMVDQSGCPVVLTSAHLNWPASYLPVTSAGTVTEPNLALGFHNSSGKAIRAATITARFLGKQSLYQLDASAVDLRLTFSGVDEADKAAEQLRQIRVPEKMYAYGITRVSLDQVTFADGTLWMASTSNSCSLDVKGSAERVEAR